MFYVHGPEWAFVIPRGDARALSDVIQVCSRVWNGAGALILLADEKGELCEQSMQHAGTRFLDEIWLHPSLTDGARAKLRSDSSLNPVEWGAGRGFADVHPAALLERWAHRVAMTRPVFTSPVEQLKADVIWGVVDHPQEWESSFEFGVAHGDLAFMTLVGGQLGVTMASPLRVSQIAMHVFGQWGDDQPWPYIWVLETGSVDELVAFWNLRAGASAKNPWASVVGLPRDALRNPSMLEAIEGWARATTDRSLRPTLLANVSPEVAPELEAALAAIGIARLPDREAPKRQDAVREMHEPTWLMWKPRGRGRILRGAWDDTEITVHAGHALATLPRPRGFEPRGGARLVIQGLPAPLPITQSAATRMSFTAVAHPRGLQFNMGSGSPWKMDLQLPSAGVAIEDWAGDHGYAIEEPPAGKDARALLQRLGGLDRLETLVDELRVEILVRLAPLTRQRLVKRLAKEFAPTAEHDQLADALTRKLRDVGLLLEVDGRTVEQIKSALSDFKSECSVTRADIVLALTPMVDAGFVQRGRNVTCPHCRFGAFLPLRELDEHVRCRGCGQSHLLPIGSHGEEASTAYRLDSLMARVMDRHVLPVILTLRALRDPARYRRPEHVWPGMLFRRDDERELDVDLLASDGQTVFAAECKLDARGLEEPQLCKLLSFTARVGATPVVAALAGSFDARIRSAVEGEGGLVLQRDELLTIGSRPDHPQYRLRDRPDF